MRGMGVLLVVAHLTSAAETPFLFFTGSNALNDPMMGSTSGCTYSSIYDWKDHDRVTRDISTEVDSDLRTYTNVPRCTNGVSGTLCARGPLQDIAGVPASTLYPELFVNRTSYATGFLYQIYWSQTGGDKLAADSVQFMIGTGLWVGANQASSDALPVSADAYSSYGGPGDDWSLPTWDPIGTLGSGGSGICLRVRNTVAQAVDQNARIRFSQLKIFMEACPAIDHCDQTVCTHVADATCSQCTGSREPVRDATVCAQPCSIDALCPQGCALTCGSVTRMTSPVVDTSCTAQCVPGTYSAVLNNTNATCSVDGEWSAPPLICQTCAAVENCEGAVTCTTADNSQCLTCKASFTLDNRGNMSVCRSDCIFYPAAGSTVNRSCDLGTITFADVCTYECAVGYYDSGNSTTARCLDGVLSGGDSCIPCSPVANCERLEHPDCARCANCSTGYAVTAAGTCTATPCSPYMAGAHVLTSCPTVSVGSPMVPGTICTHTCDIGFYGSALSTLCTPGAWDASSGLPDDCMACPPVARCLQVSCTSSIDVDCLQCEVGFAVDNTGAFALCTETTPANVVSAVETSTTTGGDSTVLILALVGAVGCLVLTLLVFAAVMFHRSSGESARKKRVNGKFAEHQDDATVKLDEGEGGVSALVADLLDQRTTDVCGTGAFGVVYKAKQANGDWIAIKQLKEKTEASLSEFHEEVNILSLFQVDGHPNVVAMKFFCTDPLCCVAMEFAVNGTLHDYLAKRDLKEAARIDIVGGVAKGLMYMHGKQVAHLDVKPRNVLLDANLVPKLSDFGVSRRVDQPEDSVAATEFTPQFAPLERIMGLVAHGAGLFKVDVFSFGILMNTVWTGSMPYIGLDGPAVIASVKASPDSRPDLPLDAPAPYNALVERCWAKEPGDRPTFEVVANEISKWGDSVEDATVLMPSALLSTDTYQASQAALDSKC